MLDIHIREEGGLQGFSAMMMFQESQEGDSTDGEDLRRGKAWNG